MHKNLSEISLICLFRAELFIRSAPKKDNFRYCLVLIEDFSLIELCAEVIMSGKGIKESTSL